MLLLLACEAPANAPASLRQHEPRDDSALSDTSVDVTILPATERPLTPLAPAALYRRASLDIRGRLPSIAELDALDANPDSIETMLDALVDDPAVEERLVDLFAERWNMRLDAVPVSADQLGIGHLQEYDYLRNVEEEPLRLMARIGTSDLPWTDIVTVDYTLATPQLAAIWPLTRADGEGWQVARYTDGRPANGVLATNGMWWRYSTTPNNYNRSRAAAVSRLLLCQDFLTRPIRFAAANLLEREDLLDATRSEPTCAACHSTLDPLAASLFGFWNNDLFLLDEQRYYHPDREWLGEYYLGVAPAWFGTPLESAADLGPMVASDDRFVSCAVETVAESLWRRDADAVADFNTLQDLRGRFEESGLRLRPLLRAVLDTPDYRAGALTPDATDADGATLQTLRMVPLQILGSAVLDATGFDWDESGWDALDNDRPGFRTLGGDVDGKSVMRPAHDPSVSRALVVRRLAEGAASTAVDHDFGSSPGTPFLLDSSVKNLIPGDPAFDDQLVRLHRRLLGTTPNAERLAADGAFFLSVRSTAGNGTQAWKTLIAGILRDPAFWTY